MQTYEVIERPVTLGMGIELKLSPSQAESRTSSLQKKGANVYTATDQVHFKRGEIITVISGNLSKLTLEHLREVSDTPSNKTGGEIAEVAKNASNRDTQDNLNNIEYPSIQHAGFGRYNAFDHNGNLLNQKPLKKHEAEKILSKLTGANEADNKKSERSIDGDINSLPMND